MSDNKPSKIPLEALIKYQDKKLKKKDEEIGELKAYIAELEDLEKKEVRKEKKALLRRDEDWKAMTDANTKLRKKLKEQEVTIDTLLARINKLESQILNRGN